MAHNRYLGHDGAINMSATIREVTPNKKRKNVEKVVPDKFDYTVEHEELQLLSDYDNRIMDFSRYNTLEEHIQLLNESNALRSHLRNNHKRVADAKSNLI